MRLTLTAWRSNSLEGTQPANSLARNDASQAGIVVPSQITPGSDKLRSRHELRVAITGPNGVVTRS